MMWPPGIQCQLCPMTFSDQSAISAHYDTAHAPCNTRPEHPDAKYPCDVCGRKFVYKSDARKHLATVHSVGGLQAFHCDVCSKSFTQKGNLKLHLSDVHGLGDVKTFPCDLCSYVAKRKSDFKRHMRNVHNQ